MASVAPLKSGSRYLLLLLAALVLGSCSGGGTSGRAEARAPLTEGRRDSVIATSRLPGAAGVAGALAAADSARARAGRSIPGAP